MGIDQGGSELTPLDPKQKFLSTKSSDKSQHDLIGSEKSKSKWTKSNCPVTNSDVTSRSGIVQIGKKTPNPNFESSSNLAGSHKELRKPEQSESDFTFDQTVSGQENKVPTDMSGINKQIDEFREHKAQTSTQHTRENMNEYSIDDIVQEVTMLNIVKHDEGSPLTQAQVDEELQDHALIVVIDSAATIGVIGRRERQHAKNIRKGQPVSIRTVQGMVKKEDIGDLHTPEGVLAGYIVDEPEYSLWPVDKTLEEEGSQHIQTKHRAMTKHADGTVTEYRKHGKLWVLMTMAMVGDATSDRDMHGIGGHAHHDPNCKFCMMGRMRSMKHVRVKQPIQPQDGITVYLDLMGDFEDDILGNVYEMIAQESTYGWIEIEGP